MSLYNSEPKYIAPHMPWPPSFCWKTDAQRCTEKFQRPFHVNQFVRLKDTPTRPWPLGRRSDHLRGQRWRCSPSSSSPRRQPPPAEAWRGRARIKAGWSFGHLLVMLSPHVDHRRSATSQPALRRTGASSGSLSLMDLFLLKAFARASLQRWHRQHLRRCKKWNLRKIWL